MKAKIYLSSLIISILLILSGSVAYSQVTLTEDSVYCGSVTTTLHASVVGDIPLSSGIVEDDIYAPSPYALGFTFDFYGTPYTQVLIGANGNLCFDFSLAGAYDPWPISAALLGNTSVLNSICGPWCDIYVPAYGIITYSSDGVAPNRRFVVNFCKCAMFSCTTQWITTQMVLNETSNKIDIYVSHKTFCTSWNGGYAIIGVQNAAGTDAVTAPGRDYPATYNCVDEAWEFTPISGGTTYSVSPVTFSPVPYPTTMLYWFDSSTGAFIDSGSTLTVTADTAETYKCGALGCSDTSFSYIRVTPAGEGVSIYSFAGTGADVSTFTNPDHCGTPDGTITLRGLKMAPASTDTVRYDYNGVAQPPVVVIVALDSSVSLSGLCAGVYSNITITQGPCTSAPAGPVTLTDPPISISSVSVINPDSCGRLGALNLNGLYPGVSYTVNYNYNGVAATPVISSSSGSGTATIPGLCAGIYSNITASFTGCDACTTAPKGPYTIINPPISISSITPTNSSVCGVDDGALLLYGLYPGQAYNITFDTNGVAYPPLTITASDSGTVNITGLIGRDTSGGGPGVQYTNIIATFTTCAACTTPPAGPITLYAPPLPPISIISATNPTQCGYCDGAITLKSVTPYSSDTIFYSFNGVAQPPIITYANADSSISLTGLCGGTYTDFSVTYGKCNVTGTGFAALVTPTLSASFSDQIFLGCHGDTVEFFNHSNSPGATLPIPFMFNWNFGDGTAAVDTETNPVHIYSAQGTYTVTLVADNHVCSSDTSISFSLVHPLKAGFVYTPSTAILCQGSQVAFTDTSIGNIVSSEWYYGNGATAAGGNTTNTYNNYGNYMAMLVVTDFVPCQDTASVLVQVDSQSNIALNITDSVICRGTGMTFTGIYTSSGNTGITWNFGNGDSLQNQNPVAYAYNATGTFTVSATAYFRACRDTSVSRVVTVFPQPAINLGPSDTTICAGSNPLVLSDNINSDNHGASWIWSTGQTGPSITVSSPGTYTATVDLDGCKSSYSVVVTNDCYMSIPNVFTPNGDGLNDYFFPRQLLTSGLVSFSMNIYNRWGELVFQTTATDGSGWDGRLNGTDQPEGVYVYIIDGTFKDGQKEHRQGNVTLLR